MTEIPASVIIIAAGFGSRLMPLTENKPKCMLPVQSIPILHRALSTFDELGLDEITVIGGYQVENLILPSGVQLVINPEYQSNNILHSLSYARNEFAYGMDTVVSYADIVFAKRIVEELLSDSRGEISLLVDTRWKRRYDGRDLHIVADAEWANFDSNGRLLKIGKGLIDHPHAIIGEITIPKRIFYSQHAVNSLFLHQPLRVGWRIKSKFRLNKSSNHSLIFRPAFSENENNSRQILKAIITNRSWTTFFKKFFISNEFRKAIFILGFEKLGIGVWTKKFIVSLQLEQKIEEGGSVITKTEKDEYGRDIPHIERSFPLSFFLEIKHIQNLISKSCSSNAKFKQYEINKEQLLSGSHHSGTARIGSSKVNGVVNKDLQVFDLKNLYICDSSILPIIGNVNLSATIGLFAIRLAKHIKNK